MSSKEVIAMEDGEWKQLIEGLQDEISNLKMAIEHLKGQISELHAGDRGLRDLVVKVGHLDSSIESLASAIRELGKKRG